MSKPDITNARFTFRRYADIADVASLQSALDTIFFDASNIKSFAREEARAAFRELVKRRGAAHN